VKAPFEPVTLPVVVVPSPQLMVAVKLDALSLLLVSVNVATLVVLGSATPSFAAVRLVWPASPATFAVLDAVAVAVPGASSVKVTVTASRPADPYVWVPDTEMAPAVSLSPTIEVRRPIYRGVEVARHYWCRM
jgi:hypothetical protein